jgi:hypothetical protein
VAIWIRHVSGFSFDRTLDIGIGHLAFLDYPVSQHYRACIEEVQDTVLHALVACSELMDTIAQYVRLRTPKLMSELRQSLNTDDTFVLDFSRQAVKPIQKRAGSVRFRKEDNLGSWQCLLPRGMIALLR